MYKLHLIQKYLRKRRIAWVSLVAVMMCTAMVIVVISVMGGWLRMFRESFHGINGDIIVTRQSLTGFPHYQAMLARIRKIPGVRGAAPALHTFGLINVYGQIFDGVQVVGLPLEEMENVSNFRQSLYQQYERNYWLVDDSRTKIWQYDQQTVYVPFDILQGDLQMSEQTDESGTVTAPARTNDIQIGVQPGADLEKIAADVQQVVDSTLV